MGELYLCATPLGNLGDITLRALEMLRQADLIAAEDTRHTRKLLNHYGIHTHATSYHEHNRQAKAALLLAELAMDRRVALVTDAGTPGIADPGYELVQEALSQGHRLTVIPGPSAVIAALVVSGIRPHPFYFQGFLPRRAGERRALLAELAEETRTGVFYEAPHRLQQSLSDFCGVWGRERQVAVARELTKQFEEVVRGTFTEAAAHFTAQPPLGEITIVTAGLEEGRSGGRAARQTGAGSPAGDCPAGTARPGKASPANASPANADGLLPGRGAAVNREALPLVDPGQIRKAVGALIDAGADTQSACKAVARALGLSKSQVYRLHHQ